MKIVFSRKGFDSAAGGAPSPIVDGRPRSLPIPRGRPGDTRYCDIGLGEPVAAVTRNRIAPDAPCHDDPLFADGMCWFGQCDAAEGHLRKQGVTRGDVFVFFGLFAEPGTGERHHRLFGWMEVMAHGAPKMVRAAPDWRDPPRPHPHMAGAWPANNALYLGPGATARNAGPDLRLTVEGGPLCHWRVPRWLRDHGLTYHANPARWLAADRLDSARRGQEFVCDIGDAAQPRRWLDRTIAAMARSPAG